jgi:predicted NACHT family NTPase
MAFPQAQLDKPHLNTPADFGRKMLDRGDLLILLDGLDEVADPGQREKVARWIEAALTAYPDCRFVFTSRFAGYTTDARLNAGFLEMQIRPLTKSQADGFIRNWYGLVERWRCGDPEQAAVAAEENAGDLIHRLEAPEFRSARVFELTRNPLLLTNICLIHMDRGNLPHTRVSLYEVCTEILLQLWREAAGIRATLPAKKSIRVLQKAAHWMHQQEKRTRASASELAPVIEPALKAVGWDGGGAGEYLRAIRDESGILTG